LCSGELKTIAECVTVYLHFDCLIREYIYSLGLKLGSNLPPHSFRRAYIYSLEKIIIWSPARRVVENAFGILAARFGVLQKPIILCPEKAQTVTLACCYLHNFLRQKSSTYLAYGNADWEDVDKNGHDGEWRASQTELASLFTTSQKNMTSRAKQTRVMFQNYFCTRGVVPWQQDHI